MVEIEPNMQVVETKNQHPLVKMSWKTMNIDNISAADAARRTREEQEGIALDNLSLGIADPKAVNSIENLTIVKIARLL